MQKYQILSKAGSGNFSDVYKARNRLTDEVVAIKEMKYSQDLEQLTRKELQIISQLDHPNIIKVKQILRNKKDVKVVFEYMDETLLELYQSSRLGINQNQIKCILFQAACALEYLHKCKIIHRDIKPENLLINRKLALVKLIDFGLAKEDYLASTDYVATRWYRSPQNLLGMRKSSTAMDIFALGCVAVQLFSLNPLFPGENTLDQLHKIIGILGTPTMQNWLDGYKQIKRKNIQLPTKSPINLKYVLPNASPDLLNLLQQMLQLNPSRRITARQIIVHPFFVNVQKFIPDHVYKQFKKTKFQNDLKKPRKISPMHSSPINDKKFMYPATASSLSSYNNYPRSNVKEKTPPKVDSNHNSRVSIQNKYYRDLSTDSKKLLPKQWDSKRTPVKFQQNSPAKFILTNQKSDNQYKQNSRMRHYFSRDNLDTKSLDKPYKPKYFQMKKDSGVIIKTLGDQIKFNVRNTAGSRNEMIKRQSQTSEMKSSPRYNVKYFKESYQKNKEDTSRQRKYQHIRNDTTERHDNNPINKVNRNKSVGLSVQRNFLSQNKSFGTKLYLNKPSFQGTFRKEY